MITIPMPTGATRVAGLLGYPASYSLSPALHNAAYRELALDAVYVVFPTPSQHLAAAVAAVRALHLLGVSVTIPHKEAVVALCDDVSDHARVLGAVNCIAVNEGKLIGHNTDGEGFVNALQADVGFEPLGKRCVVLGAGGAAKAVIAALAAADAAEVIVINRSEDRARQAAALAGGVGRVGSVADVDSSDLVVNATPLGMVGDHEGAMPIKAGHFHHGQVVADLIYTPSRTALLVEAERAGALVTNGLGMLIHQAALQIEIWTGMRPSIAPMRAAAGEYA